MKLWTSTTRLGSASSRLQTTPSPCLGMSSSWSCPRLARKSLKEVRIPLPILYNIYWMLCYCYSRPIRCCGKCQSRFGYRTSTFSLTTCILVTLCHINSTLRCRGRSKRSTRRWLASQDCSTNPLKIKVSSSMTQGFQTLSLLRMALQNQTFRSIWGATCNTSCCGFCADIRSRWTSWWLSRSTGRHMKSRGLDALQLGLLRPVSFRYKHRQ